MNRRGGVKVLSPQRNPVPKGDSWVASYGPQEKGKGMEGTMTSELAAFMRVMESRLKENAARGDWRTLNF
jgi:hypothetical protein